MPQPPVDPAQRDREHHDFWPGFTVALIGAVLVFCGARHLTGVDTTAGATAWETQLIQAFSAGGLEYAAPPDATPPPPPPSAMSEDPAAALDALERWVTEQADRRAQTWKVRVNTGAQSHCPT